jgi:1-deoxy-D-xylulose-5-phosphate reductoisomerase
MGKKISVDSATLMNKGLEIIEAHHLFGIENKKIRVIIHKQSIIHGLTLMNNGALFGYFGKPSMLNPIDHALSWPECKKNNIDPISIEDLNGMSVENVSDEDYKSLKLSRYALDKGGFYPIFLNASNEIAVNAFLSNQIKFIDIPLVIEKVIEEIGHSGNKSLETMSSLEEIVSADNEARIKALEIIGLGF